MSCTSYIVYTFRIYLYIMPILANVRQNSKETYIFLVDKCFAPFPLADMSAKKFLGRLGS